MRKRILSILSAFMLALCLPLMAQTTETEPATQQSAAVQDEGQAAPNAASEEEVMLEDESEATDEDRELPQTASPLALLAILGVGAGASALGLRRGRNR